MKKILLLIVFFICCKSTLHAQTKEETISWLKTILTSYLTRADNYYTLLKEGWTYSDFKVDKLDECEIIISYNGKSTLAQIEHYVYRAPTAGLRDLNEVAFYYESRVVSITTTRNDGCFDTRFSDYIYTGIKKREDKIWELVKKAIDHLSTFCPKKKEAF